MSLRIPTDKIVCHITVQKSLSSSSFSLSSSFSESSSSASPSSSSSSSSSSSFSSSSSSSASSSSFLSSQFPCTKEFNSSSLLSELLAVCPGYRCCFLPLEHYHITNRDEAKSKELTLTSVLKRFYEVYDKNGHINVIFKPKLSDRSILFKHSLQYFSVTARCHNEFMYRWIETDPMPNDNPKIEHLDVKLSVAKEILSHFPFDPNLAKYMSLNNCRGWNVKEEYTMCASFCDLEFQRDLVITSKSVSLCFARVAL